VAVLYSGCKVQAGKRKDVAAVPFHPYADLLISSVPELRSGWLEGVPLAGAAELPTLGPRASIGGLCTFLDRCPVRVDGLCNREAPPRRSVGGGKEILCHRSRAELEQLQTVQAAEIACRQNA
jgi:peptide/nickel transport system ATP-binding protein